MFSSSSSFCLCDFTFFFLLLLLFLWWCETNKLQAGYLFAGINIRSNRMQSKMLNNWQIRVLLCSKHIHTHAHPYTNTYALAHACNTHDITHITMNIFKHAIICLMLTSWKHRYSQPNSVWTEYMCYRVYILEDDDGAIVFDREEKTNRIYIHLGIY